MSIRPYLTFNGECLKAIELYQSAFNTKATEIMRFSDMPMDEENPMEIPDMQKNWILQATLPFGDNFMRLSDTFHEIENIATERISIAVEGNADIIKQAFNVLAEDGKVIMPMQETFFSPAFGSLHDKFGIMWTLAATP